MYKKKKKNKERKHNQRNSKQNWLTKYNRVVKTLATTTTKTKHLEKVHNNTWIRMYGDKNNIRIPPHTHTHTHFNANRNEIPSIDLIHMTSDCIISMYGLVIL